MAPTPNPSEQYYYLDVDASQWAADYQSEAATLFPESNLANDFKTYTYRGGSYFAAPTSAIDFDEMLWLMDKGFNIGEIIFEISANTSWGDYGPP